MERPSRLFSLKHISLFILLIASLTLGAQERFKIQIVDEENEGLPFAHVINRSTHALFSADSAGMAEVVYSSLTDSIEVSFIGYEMVEHTVQRIKESGGIISLRPTAFTHQAVTVVGRMGLHQDELPYEVINISSKDIQSVASSNTADVLHQSAGIFIQKSQAGGGSPIVRGFEANKLLLVVDGTRLNNSIYRSGHLHNAISVDPAILQRIELILGPNALLYGSDALGGVIHFITKSPLYRNGKPAYALNASSKVATATKERTLHLDGSRTKGKHGFLASFSYSSFGDILSGKKTNPKYPEFGKRLFYVKHIRGKDTALHNPNPFLQVGSAYQQWHFLQKWKYYLNKENQITTNLQYSSGSDIPRYDQLTQIKNGKPKWAQWDYGPLFRTLASVTMDNSAKHYLSDKFKLIGAYQRIGEERIKRKFQRDRIQHNIERLNIFNLTLDFQKALDRFYESEISYGADLQFEQLYSTAYSTTLSSNTPTYNILTRYPDGKNTSSAGGIYFLLNSSITPGFKLQAGGRWSINSLQVHYKQRSIILWPDSYYSGITNQNRALTGSMGFNWTPHPTWLIRGLVGTAFRAPNIDDVAKLRVKNGEVLIPNPLLTPEHSRNIEVSTSKTWPLPGSGSITANGTVFYTSLRNVIVRRARALPNGDSSLIIDGDPYTTVAHVNEESGAIKGVSLRISGHCGKHFTATASITEIRGYAIDSKSQTKPLAHIPPTYGFVSLKYNHDLNEKGSWLQSGVVWRFNAAKPLEEYAPSSSDNLIYATKEGTPAWQTWDIGLTYHNSFFGDIKIGITNLLDLHYRPFASGISAPGRNYYLSLKLHLNHEKRL